jgi:hypothetical protein
MKAGTLNRPVDIESRDGYVVIQSKTLGEIMAHEAETRGSIQTKVNIWLNNNPAEYQLLLWDFQEELEENLNFKYKRSQFRCWAWDNVIKELER